MGKWKRKECRCRIEGMRIENVQKIRKAELGQSGLMGGSEGAQDMLKAVSVFHLNREKNASSVLRSTSGF